MKKLGYIVLILLAMVACKTQKQTPSSNIDDETTLLVSYEQSNSQSGNVAEYKLEVYSNKQMYLTAIKNLDKNGKYMRTVSDEEMKLIAKNFMEAGFFNLKNEYISEPSENTLKSLYFSNQENTKKVNYNTTAPEELTELEFFMQSYLDRVGWVKLAW